MEWSGIKWNASIGTEYINAVCHSKKKLCPLARKRSAPQLPAPTKQSTKEWRRIWNVRMTSYQWFVMKWQCHNVTWSTHKMTSHSRTVTIALCWHLWFQKDALVGVAKIMSQTFHTLYNKTIFTIVRTVFYKARLLNMFSVSPCLFLFQPPKGGRGCLMSPPCLESQGCHLIPLCYLLSCSSA